MQLDELIRRFRVEANDKVEPYFTEDVDVIAWLNDAVEEACLRGRLLHEYDHVDVCEVPITAGRASYPLHRCLYEITSIVYDPLTGRCSTALALASEEALNLHYHTNWRTLIGDPKYAIQSDVGLRLVPKPSNGGLLQLEGYRLPLELLIEDTDQPEIHKAHHVHLIQWVLYKAFGAPDTEFFDPNRSQIAEAKFTEYFGLRPDSNLRRAVREDTPHLNHLIPIV